MKPSDYGVEAGAYYEYLKSFGSITINELIDKNVGGFFMPGWDRERKKMFAEDTIYKSVECGLADFEMRDGVMEFFLVEE